MQELLDECPPRFGFYTIGDPDLRLFDQAKECLFDQDEDMPLEVDRHDAGLGSLIFPRCIHGVCG